MSKTLFSALFLGIALGGCNAIVDLAPLTNGVCAANQKACEQQCIGKDNPQFGCGGPTCTPCTIPNAVAVCTLDQQCALAVCRTGFEDCDGRPENGCEVDLQHDPMHCGRCLNSQCVLPNATPACANRQCIVLSCQSGWGDCNTMGPDGCETDTNTSALHCGRCGNACPSGMTCVSGMCR